MGNGQSREGFEGVLPSASADKVSAAASSSKPHTHPISDAWTTESISTSGEDGVNHSETDPGVVKGPLLVGKIVPPRHALQLEESTARRSDEASEVVHAFNNAERTQERFVIPESVRKSRTLDAYADVCSEILPKFLYVSNLRVARDSAKVRALGITHVVNCCGELKHYEDGVEQPVASNDSKVDVLKLLLRDDANEDLTPFLPQVMEYIGSCRQEKENGKKDKVLVHCHQGVSRSCAFAIAYVMLEQRLSYHEAAAMVKRQRAISSPNAAFICQLLEWEKDLQAMGARGAESSALTLGGLYRLAPHSAYDPDCLVLKRCFEPSAGSARQRQNIASVRTPNDQRRLLWSQGTFVFQSPTTPTELIVWHGARCVFPEAVSTATKLVAQLFRMQTLVQPSDVSTKRMKIVEVHESGEGHTGADIDHFGYATELQWTRQSVPKIPSLFLPMAADTNINATSNGSHPDVQTANGVSAPPHLFILEAIAEGGGEDLWDQLTNYDSEDLTTNSAFLLCSMQSQGLVEGYVWLGTSCNFTREQVVQAAQKQILGLLNLPDKAAAPSLPIERQNEESDGFWRLFEAGY